MDRRHIQDADVERLRESVRGKLNLEMSSAEEMVAGGPAGQARPGDAGAGAPRGGHDGGGLDLILYGRRIADVAERLAAAGIAVSLFIDPDPRQIQALVPLAASGVTGFEINTDVYTRAADAGALAERAAADRRRGGAGDGGRLPRLRRPRPATDNAAAIAAIPGMEELNIGHFIIARAAIVGMDAAVREMLAAIGG